jgi:hypothetical protein
MTVPHGLKRPPRSCVAPRNAPENAGMRYAAPTSGAPADTWAANTMPANPEMHADVTSDKATRRVTGTPVSFAVSRSKPVA